MKTATAHLASYLLNGNTVSNKNALFLFGITNISREIIRGIENKFGLTCQRKKIDFKSRYGKSGYYYEYTLPKNQENKDGIKNIKKYLKLI